MTQTATPGAGEQDQAYRSDMRPDATPFTAALGMIPGFGYAGTLADEIANGAITAAAAIDLLDDMLAIRELEEMIVRLRSGGYEPLPGYDYRGPTHVSIGQEGTAVGASFACSGRTTGSRARIAATATRSPRASRRIRAMTDEAAAGTHAGLGGRPRRPTRTPCSRPRSRSTCTGSIAELFGKEEGYCRGRGGGMHIGDFSTRQPRRERHRRRQRADRDRRRDGAALRSAPTAVVCCFAGDGAYANGVVLESLNWAAQEQWTNHLAGDQRSACRSSTSSRTTTTA